MSPENTTAAAPDSSGSSVVPADVASTATTRSLVLPLALLQDPEVQWVVVEKTFLNPETALNESLKSIDSR